MRGPRRRGERLTTVAAQATEASMPDARPVAVILSRCAWTLWVFRRPLIEALTRAGYRVVAVGGSIPEFDQRLLAARVTFVPVPLISRGLNPLAELRTFIAILRLFRTLQPVLLHSFTIKPTIYGRLAARLTGVPAVVSTVTGLGHVFLVQGLRAALLRRIVATAYRLAFDHPSSAVVFQNEDDRALFEQHRLLGRSTAHLVRGSGVDVAALQPSPEPAGTPVVVLVGRLIWEKGIGEFVEAARRLAGKGLGARFALVGDCDFDKPNRVPPATLAAWRAAGVVELWGYRDDIAEVYRQSTLVCLPSYREGLPKSLLEAAAGRPVVTTDTAGRRDVIRHGHEGLLVPARDGEALAGAIEALLRAPDERRRMARNGRQRVEALFSLDQVLRQTLELYATLVPSIHRPPRSAAASSAAACGRPR